MRLVELISGFPGGLALTDVAELSDLSKTTAHRLLKRLVKADPAVGRPRGKGLCDRASPVPHSARHRRRRVAGGAGAPRAHGSGPELRRGLLRHKAHRQPCVRGRLAGARSALVQLVQPGIEMPPHAAATSKVIIADQDEAIIHRALSAALLEMTVNTRQDDHWVKNEFARVREFGYATCVGEIDEGLAALGTPVRQSDRQVLCAIDLTGPRPAS